VGWQCLYCTFINEDASGACIMCQKAHPKRRLIVAEEVVAAAEAEPEAAAVAFVRPSCVVWKEGSNPVEVEHRIRYIIWHQRDKGAPKK
jgi:hypothetical protein